MKVLLDTCTFLWICAGDGALSKRAVEVFQNPDNDLFMSAVSAWEIAFKHALGKLPLPDPPARFVPEQRSAHGIEPLALHEDAALHLALLPDIHKDPFDRMLICQAMVDGLVILTPDEQISRYPVRTWW